MKDYSSQQIAELIGCSDQTVRNWVKNNWLSPYRKDEYGNARFSQEQYDLIHDALPLPKYNERREWLSNFSRPTICEELKICEPADKSILPAETDNPGALYSTANKSESAKKISEIVTKSNVMLRETLGHNIDIHDLNQITTSTCEYFDFCAQNGIMPSMRRLCNWFGYSYQHIYQLIDKQSPEGIYLDQIRDAIKDNLEQAALTNAVNNISAMFILKTQHDYVEATKHIIEPSDSLLGQPKTPEEIANFIDADIVED